MRILFVSLLWVVFGLTPSCALGLTPSVVRVSAAASLTSVFSELIEDYRQHQPQHQVLINLASSGALAKQIDAGAPADLYIAANPQWMDFLAQQGHIAGPTIVTLVHNRLVCIGQPPAPTRCLDDLSQLQRIALCSPSSSPAGRYAQQALESSGVYRSLLDAGKLVIAKDVRQALRYAERQLVDAALVYASDAARSTAVTTWFDIPDHLYPSVNYPLALTISGQHHPAARQLYEYLQSPAARQLLIRHGFRPTS